MAVPSPCVDICRMDRKTGWCVACLRTAAEIRGWAKMTDHRRRQILAERKRRNGKLSTPVPPEAIVDV
ncbi:MAG: hypothetical protein JWO51_1618 [Rhodospirillales bacterium]|jgi:predicted Fe-S protein YdhL (DUF1289 family)|nr:hypothetical protein [Rhodospirillales bacterium]